MALMYFSYGGYIHPAGEVVPQGFSREVQRNDRGLATSVIYRLSLQVNIVASGDTAINSRVAEIDAAYYDAAGDAVFYLTTGSPSHIRLDNGTSLYGVQVDGPFWSLDPQNADFVTGISCTIGLRAEYAPSWITFGGTTPLAGASETYEVIGTGGPEFRMVELDNDQPQAIQVRLATPVWVVQSGEAFYELSTNAAPQYPPFADFLFPDNIANPKSDVRQRRDRQRSSSAGLQSYRSAWSYTFTFNRYPFVPNP